MTFGEILMIGSGVFLLMFLIYRSAAVANRHDDRRDALVVRIACPHCTRWYFHDMSTGAVHNCPGCGNEVTVITE